NQGVARNAVFLRDVQTFAERAGHVPDDEADVPEQVDDRLAQLRRISGVPAPVQEQQVNDQTARRDDLRAADAEAVPQVQPLRLDPEEFFERDETFSIAGLALDAPQLLACVLLNCLEVDLHATQSSFRAGLESASRMPERRS